MTAVHEPKAPPASWYGETPTTPSTNGSGDLIGDIEPRCRNVVNGRLCNKKLAEFVSRPWQIRCTRCKYLNVQE